MSRSLGLALLTWVLVAAQGWSQGPRRPPASPAKPPPGHDKRPIWPPQRWRSPVLVGWPFWYGYPATCGDPFGFPLGQTVVIQQIDFSFHNPLLDLPPVSLPPREAPPAANNDQPPPEPRPVVKPKPPPRPRDELERRADVQKFVRLGGDAFAQGDYAKAARYYQQAIDAAPLEPMGYFHLAQAQFAQQKLAEAGISIQRGLLLRPDWPNAPFEPRALYGEELEGSFDKHVAILADLVARHKNDDGLLFLLGYQLWFDGQKEEAKLLFKRAAALALNPLHVERFLK